MDKVEDLDRLRPFVALLPELTAEGASFGAMLPPKRSGRVWMIMGFDLNDLGDRFHRIGHALNDGFTVADWEEWERDGLWEIYRDDPARIATAGVRDIRRLVVRIVRNERFCDGAMQRALEIGLVGRAVRRAAELLAAEPADAAQTDPTSAAPTPDRSQL